MHSVLLAFILAIRDLLRSRAALHAEIIALRHQLFVLNRSRPARVRLRPGDRLLWVCLSRLWREWRSALIIVKPETVIAWQRQGFRLYWAWKSRYRGGRLTVSHDVRELIRTMSHANPLWGAPRIHGELRKVGIVVSQATVAKYMVHHHRPPSQTWRTFLSNHARELVAADFFLVPTVMCRVLFVLVILTHHRRRAIHVAVTAHPTAAWTAQQLREAFPLNEARRYLLRDRDHAFDGLAQTAPVMGIQEVLTAARSPWQNPYVERFIGSIRRECLDHVIIFSAGGLRRVLDAYVDHYEHSRTHLALDKDAPVPRAVIGIELGPVIAVPQVGGLHYRYERRVA
jgi:transposase InsO family protein